MINVNENRYMDLLAAAESNNNQFAVNSIGALGLFQFLPTTLNLLKVKYSLPDWNNVSNFLKDRDLQLQYERALIEDSLNYIDVTNLDRFIGIEIIGTKNPKYKGIKANLNIYGILAMIHLAGAGNTYEFLVHNKNFDDKSTSIQDYGAYFSSKLNTPDLFFLASVAIISIIVLYSI